MMPSPCTGGHDGDGVHAFDLRLYVILSTTLRTTTDRAGDSEARHWLHPISQETLCAESVHYLMSSHLRCSPCAPPAINRRPRRSTPTPLPHWPLSAVGEEWSLVQVSTPADSVSRRSPPTQSVMPTARSPDNTSSAIWRADS